jgi:hypothetical protein
MMAEFTLKTNPFGPFDCTSVGRPDLMQLSSCTSSKSHEALAIVGVVCSQELFLQVVGRQLETSIKSI